MSGVLFSEKKEIGSLGTTGLNKGKPMPYGSASLVSPNKDLDLIEADAEFFGSLEKLIPACFDVGAESVVFSICCYFADQCNFEFSPQVLASFARLGVTVTMSCYELTEKELLELR